MRVIVILTACITACIVAGWYALILVVSGPDYFVATPTFHEIPSDPSELIAGFRSYASIDAVADALNAARLPWNAVERYTRTDGVPAPLHYDQIEAHPFFHLRCRGRAVFSFLNDRLGTVAFCPDDPESYFAILNPTLSHPLTHESPTVILPNTRIQYGPPVLNDGPCVLWSDTRLDREEEIIFAKYGSD